MSDWLVDTGIAADTASLARMAELSGGRAHEVVRLEEVAEQAARTPGDYAAAFDDILQARGERGRHQVDPGLPGRV